MRSERRLGRRPGTQHQTVQMIEIALGGEELRAGQDQYEASRVARPHLVGARETCDDDVAWALRELALLDAPPDGSFDAPHEANHVETVARYAVGRVRLN